MKIGFSFGRCIRDIVGGMVDIDDVLCIIAATQIETREQLAPVVAEYMNRSGYLMGLDENECLDVAQNLWDQGKLHQPRNVQAQPYRAREKDIWADVLPTTVSDNESVQEAWNAYRVLLNLVENVSSPRHLNQYSPW
jgi:hypothetical protein